MFQTLLRTGSVLERTLPFPLVTGLGRASSLLPPGSILSLRALGLCVVPSLGATDHQRASSSGETRKDAEPERAPHTQTHASLLSAQKPIGCLRHQFLF